MKLTLGVLLGLSLVCSAFAGIPHGAAQSADGYVTVVMDIDMEEDPNHVCIGNGTLMYTLSSRAARDLRSAVLLSYGYLGEIDAVALTLYIDDVLEMLGTGQAEFDTIELDGFGTYQADIESTATGFTALEGPVESDFPPITIWLRFDCQALAYEPSADVPDSEYEPFVDALFIPVLSTGEVHPDEYIYELTADIRVPQPSTISLLLVVSVIVCVPSLIAIYIISERRKQRSRR